MMFNAYSECHFDAECHKKSIILSVIILNVIMLNVVVPNTSSSFFCITFNSCRHQAILLFKNTLLCAPINQYLSGAPL